jgi:CHAD domain-containing protein
MNSKKRAGGVDSTALHERLAAWIELLGRCGSKPTRKRVHALRVATLRLQAESERDVSELPRASHQAQAMLQFGKQAEKLRQALGPVREFDVWIGKLRGLCTSLNKPGEYLPRSIRECLRGIDRLEDRLKRKRRTAEKKLAASIEKKSDRFVEAAQKLEETPREARLPDAAGVAEELVARFGRTRAEFPVLDETHLHEFRKSIKMVRYLAEMHASVDGECARIAAQMRKLQSAIGEWHDWQALAREVRRGHHAWSNPLAELLESVSKETFETALATAHSVTAHMLGEGATSAVPLGPSDRKLLARGERGLHGAAERKLA